MPASCSWTCWAPPPWPRSCPRTRSWARSTTSSTWWCGRSTPRAAGSTSSRATGPCASSACPAPSPTTPPRRCGRPGCCPRRWRSWPSATGLTGIGVSSGLVVAGNVGTEARYEYTVIGTAVNEAARLTEVAKGRTVKVLASAESVRRASGRAGRWHDVGTVALRGRSRADGDLRAARGGARHHLSTGRAPVGTAPWVGNPPVVCPDGAPARPAARRAARPGPPGADQATGTRVTYSPKVFILTMLCRDRCGYCTFAQPPARLDKVFLSPDDVLAIAPPAPGRLPRGPLHAGRAPRGARTGGGGSTTRLRLHGRLPDRDVPAGAGPHGPAPPRQRRRPPRARAGAAAAVAPSQGMMVETLRATWPPTEAPPTRPPAPAGHARGRRAPGHPLHHRHPGRHRREPGGPAGRPGGHRRLAPPPRPRAGGDRPELPAQAGHRHAGAPCPPDEHLDAIALARLVLPAGVHVQAPPNLADDFGVLLDAGIDDWGGVSPAADHVNPERPWPALDRLRAVTEARASPWPPASPCTPSSWPPPTAGSTPPWCSRWATGPTPRTSAATTRGRCSPSARWRTPRPAPGPRSSSRASAPPPGTPAPTPSRPP